MKKVKILTFLGLTIALGASVAVASADYHEVTGSFAANFGTDTALFLKPNDNWKQASAQFSAYCFNDSTKKNAFTTGFLEDEDGDGIYSGKAPSGTWEKVIFVRHNSSATSPSWDNKWNQTGNLTYTSSKPLFTISGSSWDSGTWSAITYSNYMNSNAAVYLDPAGLWNTDNAKFAFYCFNDLEEGWSNHMTQIQGATTTMYETVLPASSTTIGRWTRVIGVRLDPSKPIDWPAKWNQTSNITPVVGGTNVPNHLNVIITGMGAQGSNSVYTLSTEFSAQSRASCYADYFLDQTKAVCNGNKTVFNELSAKWTLLSEEYNRMHTDTKSIVTSGDYEDDADFISAIQRYDFIINKYSAKLSDFAGRKAGSNFSMKLFGSDSTSSRTGVALVVVSLASVICTCFVIKKRKSLSK